MWSGGLSLVDIEKAKLMAARVALSHVTSNMVLGVGTGSTVAYFVKLLAEKSLKESLRVEIVPTSYQSMHLAIKNGLRVTTLDEHPELDLAIDGADEIDQKLNLIKGRGAALTKEKVVASSAKEFVVIADSTKFVKTLGEKHPVPVEVMPFAWKTVLRQLERLGGEPVLREAKDGKDGPVVTDNGNLIIDVKFHSIQNPEEVEAKIKLVPGVVEVGLFTSLASIAYIGYEDRVEKLTRASAIS